MPQRPRTDQQSRLPFGAAETEHQARLQQLSRLNEHFPLSLRETQFLKWIEFVFTCNGGPLRQRLNELAAGGTKWGLSCHVATVARLVNRLEEAGIIRCKRASNGSTRPSMSTLDIRIHSSYWTRDVPKKRSAIDIIFDPSITN